MHIQINSLLLGGNFWTRSSLKQITRGSTFISLYTVEVLRQASQITFISTFSAWSVLTIVKIVG